MKNYRNKLEKIKPELRRNAATVLFKSIASIDLFLQWVRALRPAQIVVPAVALIVVNMIITVGIYQSIYHFFLVTISIITLAITPSLFKTKNAHWLGAPDHQHFSDLVVFSILQFALGIQSYILTRDDPETFISLLFVSYLVSLIFMFVFKSYVWLRWSFKRSAQ